MIIQHPQLLLQMQQPSLRVGQQVLLSQLVSAHSFLLSAERIKEKSQLILTQERLLLQILQILKILMMLMEMGVYEVIVQISDLVGYTVTQTLNITALEVPYGIEFTEVEANPSEGEAGSYTAVLTSAPTAAVTIPISSTNGSVSNLDPSYTHLYSRKLERSSDHKLSIP